MAATPPLASIAIPLTAEVPMSSPARSSLMRPPARRRCSPSPIATAPACEGGLGLSRRRDSVTRARRS